MRNIPFFIFLNLSVLYFSVQSALGQQKPVTSKSLEVFGIPASYDMEKRALCKQILDAMPPEVRWGMRRKENEIFFSVSDVQWIDQLIVGENDGIAVDIVSRESYACGKTPVPNESPTQGTLLTPVYKSYIRSKGTLTSEGGFVVKIGEVPAGLRSGELEFNIVLIKDKRLCYYNSTYDIPQFRWGLLDMGLFWNTPSGKERIADQHATTRTALKFVIPFEKDTYEYKAADIQPIYDSLKLKDFEIKSVTIRAYASVEGSEERNVLLQRKRAESIIGILQSYQVKDIRRDIVTAENWVEFLQDIENTPYATWQAKSKAEIKEALQKEALNPAMEAILRRHRKGVLYIELERKVPLSGQSTAAIQQAFQQAIGQKRYQQALTIQSQVFASIDKGELPVALLDSLQIPVKAELGSLLNNRLVFMYRRQEPGMDTLLPYFIQLRKALPANSNVAYNVCALQIKAWEAEELTTDPQQLRKDIQALAAFNIDKGLVKRLLLNYEIIHCEYLMRERKYAEKDKALKVIFDTYTQMTLSEEDAVSLAHYLYSYSQPGWAVDLLAKYVTKVDVPEDLLFYYLSLTMVYPLITETTEFRLMTLNAANVNRNRFCTLFNSTEKGGVSFQLLDDLALKKRYCESCKP